MRAHLPRAALLSCAVLLAGVGTAAAQSRAFNVDHMQLAITSGDFLATEGASLPAWTWRLGVAYGFTDSPLLVDESTTSTRTLALVSSRSLLDATFGAALGRRVSIGVDLPVLLAQSGMGLDGGGALGDLKLAGRVTAYRGSETELAAMIALRVPTGATDQYLGEGNVVAELRGVADWTRGRVRLGANLGVRVRDTRQIVDLTVGPELLASAAVGVRAHERVDLFAELHVDTALSDHFFGRAATPVEALLGLTTRWRGVAATAAIGTGLVEGYGDPRVRLVVSLAYQPERRPPPLPPPPPPPAPKQPVAAPPPPPPAPTIEPEPLEPTPVFTIDPEEPEVQVSADLIELAHPVYFDTDSAHVSRTLFEEELRELVRAIHKRPWIQVLWIEGHADSRGTEEYNLALSNRRAASVKRTLERLGVAPERLRTLGFGETKPWFSNAQREGRARNRRVMFIIERAHGAPSEAGAITAAIEENAP